VNVLITGAAGFLGQRLARKLLERGHLRDADGCERPIRRLVLIDLVAAPGSSDARVSVLAGNLGDPEVLERAVDAETTSVFHLAAVVSGQAEADFDLGMRVNLDASRLLLEACRRHGRRPRIVFASSVAVYGGALPVQVDDDTALHPQSSYGTQKAMAELLLADYSRRAYVEGRILRLPTIAVRPGRLNQATSSFASGIIRESLAGMPAVCPVLPQTRLWLLSPRQAIACLMRGHDLDGALLDAQRSINLPGVSVTVGEMVEALGRAAGPAATERVVWQRDALIERIVGSWPARWDTSRAQALGFEGDRDFDAIVRAYVEDDCEAAPTPG
jgi:nucleoside-diphosphate-sugar epimerase